MDIIAAVFLVASIIASSLANVSLAERNSLSSSQVAVDRESLLAIKTSINRDPNHVLHNWNDVLPNSLSHCNWTRITCSSEYPGRVVSLDLSNSTLQGTISPHIGNLSFLLYLDLSINEFNGVIPATMGHLHKLKVLNLYSNFLSGYLPQELGLLENLQLLYVFSNSLTDTIPSSLLNCTKLTQIGLSNNSLAGNIPEGIGSLTHLVFLNLAYNFLTGSIPVSLVNCTSLEVIGLNNNHLHGTLPTSLGVLPNMKELYLDYNQLGGDIPKSLSNATGLAIIDLSANHLHGIIPLSFGELSALERFSAFGNKIESGIRGSYQPIPILQALCNCSKLHVLALSSNKLQGALPSMLPNHLQELYLYENQIGGNIPPSIGNLSRLTTLSLFSNNLKGSIPTTIASLKSLQRLDLHENLLEGTIPEEISSLSKSIAFISLANNHLTGSIPKSIGQLSSLRRLYLNRNSLSGTITHELGKCVSLEDLVLSSNNLSGEIPREVANLRNINFSFNLSNNKLSGTIPHELAGLQMALNIDLSNNHLSGQIGLYMANWLNAEYINMSNNNFSGSLPDSFGTKQTGLNIKEIDISYNNFSGSVPSSLYNYFALQFLNFSYNNFEGRISCIGAFKKVTHSSFLHNHRLCGKCMGLPDCVHTSAMHTHSHFYKAEWFVIIVVIVGLLCMLPSCYLLLFKKLKQQRLNTREQLNNQHRGVSKEEVIRATNNLSKANLLGAGSYGAVYSGVLQSGEIVAVKIFDITNQQRSNASFTRECQTLGKVRHRNLTKIITVCCEDNFRAIVLPLMTKGNLHDLLHERDIEGSLTPITLEMRMNIISELAGALSYLHHDCTPSIIHCDVKPENILLDNDMTVKLTDFGIAKLMGTNPESTTLSLRGSVGYIAPEYGLGGDVTSKGDVYSFGVVVLEAMTRKKPTDDMFNGSMSMLEWVSMALAAQEDNNKEKIKSILEIVNYSEEDLKMMERVIKLGIFCCNEDPVQRPTMREVENLLSMFVGSDAGRRRAMPNLDDILASLHASRGGPTREPSFSSTF